MVELCLNIGRLIQPRRLWLCNTGSTGVNAFCFHFVTPGVTVHYIAASLAATLQSLTPNMLTDAQPPKKPPNWL
jgi:hypothetical protein